ncbi:MAG TPA: hypothetical protein VI215_06285 [Bacteroidota bacterium]|jgi:hypothetical protein
MKYLLSILLCSSLLLEGCYSSFTLTEQDRLQSHPKEDENILVTLKDGSRIESEEYHHIEVKKPSDFIYVEVGERFDRKAGIRESFKGSIQPVTIDSSEIDSVSATGFVSQEKRYYFNFGLSDGSKIRCLKSDCFTVTSAQGAGLWCVGRLESNHVPSRFIGMIPVESIRQIDVSSVSGNNTVLLVVGIASGVGLVLLFLFPPNLLGSGNWHF